MAWILTAIIIFTATAIGFLISSRQDIIDGAYKTGDLPPLFLSTGIFAIVCANIVNLKATHIWLSLALLPFQVICWVGLLILGWVSVLFFGAWILQKLFNRKKSLIDQNSRKALK